MHNPLQKDIPDFTRPSAAQIEEANEILRSLGPTVRHHLIISDASAAGGNQKPYRTISLDPKNITNGTLMAFEQALVRAGGRKLNYKPEIDKTLGYALLGDMPDLGNDKFVMYKERDIDLVPVIVFNIPHAIVDKAIQAVQPVRAR
jgi:hypothetical protein